MANELGFDPNTINQLMNLDPLELSNQNLKQIIAYNIATRAAHDRGVKPKKAEVQIDLVAVGILEKVKPIFRRKVT